MAYLFGVMIALGFGLYWLTLALAIGPVEGSVLWLLSVWIISFPIKWLWRRVSIPHPSRL